MCVPNMFMGRFRLRHMYLQPEQDLEALAPQVRSAESGWEESLGVVFYACRDLRELRIVSPLLPTAVNQHAVPDKHDDGTETAPPRKYGSLWGFDAHQFGVARPNGTTMSASADLLLFPSSADTDMKSHFVALFGYSLSAYPHCHLEPLGEIVFDISTRDFWAQSLRRRTPRETGDDPSDRSTLVLPCGVRVEVAAAAKHRPGGVPHTNAKDVQGRG